MAAGKSLNDILSLAHQKLFIDIDFENERIRGITELTFTASVHKLKKHADFHLFLNCRDQMRITGAFFNEDDCISMLEHEDLGTLKELDLEDSNLPHKIYFHDRYRQEYLKSTLSPDITINLEEFIIKILPVGMAFDDENITDITLVQEGNEADIAENDEETNGKTEWDEDEISFTVKLSFITNEEVKPVNRFGYFFIDNRYFYTASQSLFWFPAHADLNNIGYSANCCCTWDIDVSVPLFDSSNNTDMVVVANGDLIKQVINPANTTRKICSFSLNHPTNSRNISIVAGPLTLKQLSGFPSSCQGFAFCPAGYESAMEYSLQILPKAFEFCSQYIGASFPFSSFKLVFLPEPLYHVSSSYCTMAIMSTRFLHDQRIIDETFESRIEFTRMISSQWFGQYIFPKSWADNWLLVGIANYIIGLFVKKHFGNNEYRFRLKKDMEKCYEIDIEQPPLYVANSSEVVILDDLSTEPVAKLKAPLVVYMLEKFLGKNMLQKILNKTILSAISGELVSGLSTSFFLKSIKKISGKEPKPFADQWIYRSGTPKLNATYVLNKKKNIIELTVKQDENRPLYVGNMTVRVHEPDGTFDHVVAVEELVHNFELLYHTKYKRQRQNKKTMLIEMKMEQERLEREQAEGLLPPPGTEEDEYMCQTDPEIINEFAKSEWKEVDEAGNEINVPISWIRLDPELDLVCQIDFEQSDYMDAQQLAKDKDPIAQYEAVKRMKKHSNPRIAACLFKCLMDVRTYYRVRMEAAHSLASGFGNLGLYYLYTAFRKKFCVKNSFTTDNQVVPRRNDFRAFTEYFIQKAIPEALSSLRDDYGRSPINVLRFLLNLLKLNDNTGNQFSDHGYISSLIDAICRAVLPLHGNRKPNAASNTEDVRLREKILDETVKEIERLLFLETQVPSYRNSIGMSCLRAIIELTVEKKMPIKIKPFLLFSRYPNFEDIRIMALDGLCILGIKDCSVVEYLISLVRNDPSVAVRSAVPKKLGNVLYLFDLYRRKLKEDEDQKKLEKQKMTIDVDVEDLSLNLESTENFEKIKTRLEELESFRRESFMKSDIMDCLHELVTKSCVYDDRTRRAIFNMCEICYDKAEFEIIPAPMEVPKLKLLLKTTEQPKSNVALTEPTHDIVEILKNEVPDVPVTEHCHNDADTQIKVSEGKTENETPPAPVVTSVQAPKIKLTLTLPSLSSKPESVVESKEIVDLNLPIKPSFDTKKAKRVIEKLMTQKFAYFFNQPVDPIRDEVPTYFEIVKEPMDLGTVRRKLEYNEYETLADFEYDVTLVFENSFKFNNPNTIVYQTAKNLEKLWKKDWFGIKDSSRKKMKLSLPSM